MRKCENSGNFCSFVQASSIVSHVRLESELWLIELWLYDSFFRVSTSCGWVRVGKCETESIRAHAYTASQVSLKPIDCHLVLASVAQQWAPCQTLSPDYAVAAIDCYCQTNFRSAPTLVLTGPCAQGTGNVELRQRLWLLSSQGKEWHSNWRWMPLIYI